ncbi:uncharacterized protein [Cicer arietinum]|uniref:uncharacterized protein n=1 Tax=Cicer arietinum TaxID=3827 RepID=UPI003CC54133
MYEGLEPDFEEMYYDLDSDFEEMYDDLKPNFDAMNDKITSEVEVIVTDRDIALMNAVEYVFPKAMNLLCLFHICKNVKAKCKMNVFPKNKQVQIMEAWEALIYSYGEAQYYMKLSIFEGICSTCSIFYDYVHEQWLIPHKEKFVETWTNRVMHFGNITTQRVESAHWSLKRILQDSIGDICNVWETISSMIVLQHNEIIASFEKNIIQKVHRHSNKLYTNFCGVVSKNAIDLVATEYDGVKYVGIDQNECRCTIRTTHGLPCACEIAKYSMIPHSIPLDVIHVWWSKLTFHVNVSSKPSKLSVKYEIDVIVKKFEELDVPGKISLKGKSKVSKRDTLTKHDPSWWEYVDASVRCSGTNACSTITTSKVQKLAPRPSVQKLTPRPSVSKVQQPTVLLFKDWLPVEIHKFIDNIIDVGDDGDCGYRAVAGLLGMGENCWAFIRQQCVVELQEFMSHYNIIFGGENFVR